MQAVTSDVTPDVNYAPYLFSGTVQLEGVKYPTRILRDTGSSISLWVKPNHVDVGGDEFILIKGVTGALTVPLLECDVVCDLFSGKARVGVVDNLPEDGVDLILGNDLVRGDDVSVPVLTRVPVSTNVNKENNVIDLEVFPACAVTRSMFREEERRREEGTAQARMKRRYDEKAQPREFQVGEEVLALLPLQGKFLAAQCSGSYVVERRVGEVDYVVKTPDRCKSHQLCHKICSSPIIDYLVLRPMCSTSLLLLLGMTMPAARWMWHATFKTAVGPRTRI